jgi:hypothetical protein
MNELKDYINKVSLLSNAVLLGTFEKKSNKYLGKVKFSKINSPVGFAEIGIVIGQRKF